MNQAIDFYESKLGTPEETTGAVGKLKDKSCLKLQQFCVTM